MTSVGLRRDKSKPLQQSLGRSSIFFTPKIASQTLAMEARISVIRLHWVFGRVYYMYGLHGIVATGLDKGAN
ncbi:hypothetical protein HanXRQr2_Chr12g0523901 [Helianthus annuus]|uniref:Uncharacterized protein n=1 Tax=Helianthus annuus TaxID=4232 RepID=A0A251T038_HELAN|nr:hypothetical protein HanXRQr2_Chr12g0523901 [Helianthus annuus]KAJ0491498.1 hypothetical protein HanIR_Chr12g0564431 [Helianthus annuus]